MTGPHRRLLAPMRARSADEPYRASTPLELLFDLCFVIAVSQAATPLHHAVATGHLGATLQGYLVVFFAIWWAWMNFSWFASAYDTDDLVYRVTTLVQIAGALVLAAGIGPALENGDLRVNTAGYIVMRLAMVVQWLRAARSDKQRRRTAARYAIGVVCLQILWLLRLAIEPGSGLFLPSVLVLILLELVVPIWAEVAPGGPTTFNPHHIAERYGGFTLIVLGEAVASATVAFRAALDEGGDHVAALLRVGVAGLVILFVLWWLYFDRPAHTLLTSLRTSLLWGYGHYFIFASAAAVGAGLGVAVDHAAGHSSISDVQAGYAVAVPVAIYLFFVWLLHLRPHLSGAALATIPLGVVLTLVVPLAPASIEVLALVLVGLVVVSTQLGGRQPVS
ncbi:low temperature requirement protein A [Actinoplanes sp. TBRC 11911]|uniref:low temperature requirement protein A n=1 Tax=Actinoplanes sp. TBRC 11911 TaxID=2729386 RepID=UPI00145F0E7F|nr:low temperature requirement protein A [Actinoplanes sp. TBRC 11911]NMO51101.1 low temperature requirement protein A [Actinoplanes sp. TBRC 11911]